MLKFNRLLVLTLVLLTGSLMLNMHAVVPVTVIVVSILLLTYGCFSICSGMFVKAVCRTGEKGVLLTFDDGPDPETTPRILDILEKHNITALFFMTGKKVVESPRNLSGRYLKTATLPETTPSAIQISFPVLFS